MVSDSAILFLVPCDLLIYFSSKFHFSGKNSTSKNSFCHALFFKRNRVDSDSFHSGVDNPYTGPLTYPYQIPTIGLMLAFFLSYKALTSNTIPWKETLKLGGLSITMIWALIYYGVLLPQNPVYNQYLINNEIPPPPPHGLLIGLGILVILLVLGIRKWWVRDPNKIISLWLLSNLITIYLPLRFSGRLIIGLFIPVSIVAA